MTVSSHPDLKSYIRDVPDFPKKGIVFKDITPILKDKQVLRYVVDCLAQSLKDLKVDYVAGVESRGFIFSPMVAYKINAGFIPVRKAGKLPYRTERIAYSLEYGEAVLEIHQDALEPGSKVVLMDDLLATGGTALAAAHLVEKLGGKVARIAFSIELAFLNGRKQLAGYDVTSLIQY